MYWKKFKTKCLNIYIQRFIDLHFMVTHEDLQKFRKDVMGSLGFKLYLQKQHIVYLFEQLRKKVRKLRGKGDE